LASGKTVGENKQKPTFPGKFFPDIILALLVQMKQENPAVADKPARRLRKVCTVYVRAVGL